MKLRDVLPTDAAIEMRNADIDVGGVSADTRAIKRGDIFVAIAGGKADGLSFIGVAIAAGAVAVVAERVPDKPLPADDGFRESRQRAACTRAYGGEVFSPPAADDCSDHRYQRQNLGRRVHASNLDGAGTSRCQHRHHRHRVAARRNLWLADHAGPGGAAPFAGRAGGRWRHTPRYRSVVAWSRSVPS